MCPRVTMLTTYASASTIINSRFNGEVPMVLSVCSINILTTGVMSCFLS